VDCLDKLVSRLLLLTERHPFDQAEAALLTQPVASRPPDRQHRAQSPTPPPGMQEHTGAGGRCPGGLEQRHRISNVLARSQYIFLPIRYAQL
jgi:hypothetical protein